MSDEIDGLYQRLTERLLTHTREAFKGGPKLTYITTQAATTHLNTVLGADGWSFAITERWYETESDCCCVRGVLTVTWPSGRATVHEDIGGQVVNRKKSGAPVELAYDWKGARSDCLKRCAADIGIGLWLYGDDRTAAAPQQAPASSSNGHASPVLDASAILQQGREEPDSVWDAEASAAERLALAIAQARLVLIKSDYKAINADAQTQGLPVKAPDCTTDEQRAAWAGLLEEAIQKAGHVVGAA